MRGLCMGGRANGDVVREGTERGGRIYNAGVRAIPDLVTV